MLASLVTTWLRGEGRGRHFAGNIRCHLRLAEVGNVHDLEVHDASADKCRYRGGHDLRPESVALWYFEVVGQLQVVGEIKGMCRGHISTDKCIKSVANHAGDPVETEVRLLECNNTYPKHLKKFIARAFPGCQPPPMNSARTLREITISTV